MPVVKLFTSQHCIFCHKAKDFLKHHNIKFIEIDIEKSQKEAIEMVQKTGARGFPVIVINDNFKEAIIGFDEPLLRKKLNIK